MTFDERMKLASAAESAGDAEQAYQEYCAAVAMDASRPEAWLGKARAAGRRFTGRTLSLGEVGAAVGEAVERAPAGRDGEIRSAGASLLRQAAIAQHARSAQRLQDYVSAMGEWRGYLERCQVVIRALEQAHALDPADPFALEKIIEVCSGQIAGLVYNDVGDYQVVTQRRHGITPEYEAQLRAKVAECAAALAGLRPGYVAPQVKKAELDPKSTCFVVTAAMGDPLHPDVVTIRRWRDERLARTAWGRPLVAVYASVGPAAAAVVRRSGTLRALVRALLVKPMAAVLREIA